MARLAIPSTHLIVPLLAAGLGLLSPRLADACGGTFCDASTLTPMPVDQVGEDILFVRDGDEFEVHVRIAYTGEAESFAWLVPLPQLPEVSIGSERLFERLSERLVPLWSSTITGGGNGGGGCPPGGCFDASGGPPPMGVVFDEIVGSYEVVILDVATVAEVFAFFDQNAYAYDQAAAPLLQTYLDEGSLITAVKLTAEASVNEIHPLVFRFVSDEPCVPIRLTAVAALSNMGVRAYFLGEHRWAPTNYQHVVLNPLPYDWSSPTTPDYRELLSLAVDEAGGHAFVTEYAGPSSEVPSVSVWPPEWHTDGFEAMDANTVIDALFEKGLIGFDAIHPHVLAALRIYIPVPQDWGAPELDYWIDHAQHPALLEQTPFDAVGFAAMLDERLFMPAMHAADLLDTFPYLTRLHTTISPEEMTLDPTFHEVPDLPEVREDRRANGLRLDNGFTRFEIPESGADEPNYELMCVSTNGAWPLLDDMPRALRIEQIPAFGPPQVLDDRSTQIHEQAKAAWENSACATSDEGGSESGDGGWGGESSDDGPGLEPSSRTPSCACSSDARGGGAGSLALALLLLAGVRRRARPRSRACAATPATKAPTPAPQPPRPGPGA